MTAPAKCTVTWCTWGGPNPCNGDHWASPGEGDWPDVQATAFAPNGREVVMVAPTWGELDGLSPAVLLWLQRISADNATTLDDTFELTPDEADALAAHLVRAAEAARKTMSVTHG